jgi:hypothetical protein
MDIIEKCPTVERARIMEIALIAKLRELGSPLTNLTDGGDMPSETVMRVRSRRKRRRNMHRQKPLPTTPEAQRETLYRELVRETLKRPEDENAGRKDP